MIKAVIFDFDGLLVDSEYICYEIFRDFLATYQQPFPLSEYVAKCSGRQLTSTIQLFHDQYNDAINMDTFKAYMDQSEVDLEAQAPLKKGAVELLDYLKAHDIKIAMATSSTKERTSRMLAPHGVEHYFDDGVYHGDIKNGKPAPDVFLKAIEKLGVQAEEAIVLEDSESGIKASYNAHIPVICIPDLKVPTDEVKDMATAILDDLTCVIDYIDKENDMI